jgi:hypothetical protein
MAEPLQVDRVEILVELVAAVEVVVDDRVADQAGTA